MSSHKLWQKEFEDYLAVLDMGATKYGPDDWLKPNSAGARTSHKGFHDSMFHHLAQSFAGIRNDTESGLDHLLHLITNAQMMYTRIKRGIVNDKDLQLDVKAALENEKRMDWKLTNLAKVAISSREGVIEGNQPQYKPLETRSPDGGYYDEEE